MHLLPHLLQRFVRKGKLTVTFADDSRQSFGNGADGPDVAIRLADKAVEREIFFNPELKVAEAYMDERLVMENGGTVFDLLMLFSVNRSGLAAHPVQKALRAVWKKFRRRQQSNKLGGEASSNIRYHYDIPPKFYRLWLDETMTYSCAYYTSPDVGLHQAQIDKLRHIAAKLKLEPGMHIAEIGSGWGALATFLARNYDVRVTSVTLSPEQLAVARERAEAEGVADKVTFLEKDYRELEGTYDRVVSIAMMEAIGIDNFDNYFSGIKKLTKPGGFALVHCIGRMSPPGTTAPFIRKYIFPGGYVPSLSEVAVAIEQSGLRIGDIECLRLHYAKTLRCWFERFSAKANVAEALKDDRFVRMWRYYLAASEQTFRHGPQDVFQFQLSRKVDAVPITRDYLYPPTCQGVAQAAE